MNALETMEQEILAQYAIEQFAAEQNIRSLRVAPITDERLRARLIAMAQFGGDVYAYQSAAGKWNLWVIDSRYELEACNNMTQEERDALF